MMNYTYSSTELKKFVALIRKARYTNNKVTSNQLALFILKSTIRMHDLSLKIGTENKLKYKEVGRAVNSSCDDTKFVDAIFFCLR